MEDTNQARLERVKTSQVRRPGRHSQQTMAKPARPMQPMAAPAASTAATVRPRKVPSNPARALCIFS